MVTKKKTITKTPKLPPVTQLAACFVSMVEGDDKTLAEKFPGLAGKDDKRRKLIATTAVKLARETGGVCFFCGNALHAQLAVKNLRKIDWSTLPVCPCLNQYRVKNRDYIPGWDTKEGAAKLIRDLRCRRRSAADWVYSGECKDCGEMFIVTAGVVVYVWKNVLKPGQAYRKHDRCVACAGAVKKYRTQRLTKKGLIPAPTLSTKAAPRVNAGFTKPQAVPLPAPAVAAPVVVSAPVLTAPTMTTAVMIKKGTGVLPGAKPKAAPTAPVRPPRPEAAPLKFKPFEQLTNVVAAPVPTPQPPKPAPKSKAAPKVKPHKKNPKATVTEPTKAPTVQLPTSTEA